MKRVAIIPARGGSKRIPRKNIKNFLGAPIISYSIAAAIASKLFDKIIVSTDDNEIATIAKTCGADVPFIRSKENSSDFATTADVVEEVIQALANKGQSYDYICCIYPTAPFVNEHILLEAFQKLNDNNGDSLFPVCRFGFPPQRALIEESNKVYLQNPEYLTVRSQDLKPLYHDAGQFYWIKYSTFLSEKKLYTENSVFYEVAETAVQDIDNPIDWLLAESKYQLLNPLNRNL